MRIAEILPRKGRWPEGPEGVSAAESAAFNPLTQSLRESSP
jgi:hypothetical protein